MKPVQLSCCIVALLVCFRATLGLAQITRPELKCLSAPAYWPGPGVQFTEDLANDCAALKVDMLRVEMIGENDLDRSICYSAYDIIVDRAAAREMKILGLIDYQSVAWDDQAEWETAAFRQRFVERTEEIVTHFSQRANPIKHWEIWNEQDICVTGFCVRIEPVSYAQILIDCYHAIKAIDPDATVVFGGLSPKGFEYTANYLADFYAIQSVQDHYSQYGYHPFDVMACHPYPETFTRPNPWLGSVIDSKIKAVMNANGDAHKKVWLTEMGWNSAHVTETQQASYLETSFEMMDTHTDPANPGYGPYVERYFWFQYRDFGSSDYWGLWTSDLSRQKPSYGRYYALGPADVTKPIPPPETAPPGVTQELAVSVDALTTPPTAGDPLNGILATRTAGGFHPDNIDPADHEPAFTDGLGLGHMTGLLQDFPGQDNPAWSGFWVLDNGNPANFTELRVYSGNTDRDGRVFHHYDIYVTNDPVPSAGSAWTLVLEQVAPAFFGASNAGGLYEAAMTRVVSPDSIRLATAVTALRIDFFAVTQTNSQFYDTWEPCTPNDTDGGIAAYSSPILFEVDAWFAPALPDFDDDGDIDQMDFGVFQYCLSGTAIPQNDPTCDRARLDDDVDVDENDTALFLGCMTGPNVPLQSTCLN